MAKIVTTKKTVKSTPSKSSGTVPCNMCKGTGRLKSGYNKKKK